MYSLGRAEYVDVGTSGPDALVFRHLPGAADAGLADRAGLRSGKVPSYPVADGFGFGGQRGGEAR
jgi:hypothetical protein